MSSTTHSTRPIVLPCERRFDHLHVVRYYVRACTKLRIDGRKNIEDCKSFTIWGFNKYTWAPVFFARQGEAAVMWEDYTRKPSCYALRSTLLKANPGGEQRGAPHPAYRQ